jgi:hypothetical protein
MLLGHPLQGAKASFILKKDHGGIELANHLPGEILREGHDRNETLFFTYLQSFSKVVEVGAELVHAYGVLGATLELFGPIDLVVDLLLIDVMKVGIGALASISWEQIRIGSPHLQELAFLHIKHGLLGSPCPCCCISLSLGGPCRHDLFLLIFAMTTRGRLDFATTGLWCTCEQQRFGRE